MRAHFIWDRRTEKFVTAAAFHGKRAREVVRQRSLLPAPYFISDNLPGGRLLNHADGREYTSKAEFRRATRAAGCEEVGTEKLPSHVPKQFKLSDEARREVRQRVAAKWDGKRYMGKKPKRS